MILQCFTRLKDRKFTWMFPHCVMSQDDGWHGKKSLWKAILLLYLYMMRGGHSHICDGRNIVHNLSWIQGRNSLVYWLRLLHSFSHMYSDTKVSRYPDPDIYCRQHVVALHTKIATFNPCFMIWINKFLLSTEGSNNILFLMKITHKSRFHGLNGLEECKQNPCLDQEKLLKQIT